MRSTDQQRAINQRQKLALKQHQIISQADMKEPEKNIKVVISPKLTVWTDCESKVESIRKKYAGK